MILNNNAPSLVSQQGIRGAIFVLLSCASFMYVELACSSSNKSVANFYICACECDM